MNKTKVKISDVITAVTPDRCDVIVTDLWCRGDKGGWGVKRHLIINTLNGDNICDLIVE